MSKFGEVMTWDVYQTYVKKRFELVFEDPLVELKNLKQTTTVQVYQDFFEELLNKVDINEPYSVSLFIGGLKEEIAYSVRMFKPTSLSEVFSLSELQEASNSVTRSRHSAMPVVAKNTVFGTINNRGRGSGISTVGAMPVQATTIVPNRHFKKLTQKELEEKRAKQWFLVKKMLKRKNVRKHTRYNGRGRGYATDLTKCYDRSDQLSNYEGKRSCQKTGVAFVGRLWWTIQGQVFETDVMILPLEGCEMVLGIQWLATLGTIQFDFKNLVMDFVLKGKRCVLRGTPQSTLQWIKDDWGKCTM
ncbi:hypothetical protein Tco_1445438 [Tanacetum coccineum]